MRKALWQLANTFIPYVILWVLMIQSVLHGYHYGITLALAALAGCLLVRIFIFFHDACHASFFASRKANQILGYITGVLTFTPFRDWQKSHIKHHGTAGDLDNRGSGDVWTMTVEEYQSAPWTRRLAYRLYRNPLILFGLGPAYMFLVSNRFPKKHAGKKERRSVLITNVSLLVLIVVASWTMGFWTYVKIQIPVLLAAGTIGIWLFYVQHQFEGVYWARQEDRDQIKVALQGSSHYKLPAPLQWITGNIGLHHIHHMYPRIPNYNLQECYEAIKPLQEVPLLTLGKSLHCLRMRLWDEANQRLVGFSEASKLNASGVKN
jgi:omega-6 fatty acid desaturase (delta-12 desaturase)